MPASPSDLAARFDGIGQVLPDLELAILFGSVAAGRAGPRSDVDVAVQCAGPADLDAIYMALARRLGTDRLDLVHQRRASHAFIERHRLP